MLEHFIWLNIGLAIGLLVATIRNGLFKEPYDKIQIICFVYLIYDIILGLYLLYNL